jgi:hypothetical protein
MTSPGIRLLPSPSLSPASDFFAWRDQQLLLERHRHQQPPSDVKCSDTDVTSSSHPTAARDSFDGQSVHSVNDKRRVEDKSSPREFSCDLKFQLSSDLIVEIANKSADDDEHFLSAASSPFSPPPNSRLLAELPTRRDVSTSSMQRTLDCHNLTCDAQQSHLSNGEVTEEIRRSERMDNDNDVEGSRTDGVTSPFRCGSAVLSSPVGNTRNADCELSDNCRLASSNCTVADALPDLKPMEIFECLRYRKNAAAAECANCVAIEATATSNGDCDGDAEVGPLSASTPLDADVAVFSAGRSRIFVPAAADNKADKSNLGVIDRFGDRSSRRSTDLDDNVMAKEGATIEIGISSAESLSKEITEGKEAKSHGTDGVGHETAEGEIGIAFTNLSPPPPFDLSAPPANDDVIFGRPEMPSQSDGQMTNGSNAQGDKLGSGDRGCDSEAVPPRKPIIFGHIPPPKYLFTNQQHSGHNPSSNSNLSGASQTCGYDDQSENVEQNSRQRAPPSSRLSHFRIVDIDIDGSSAPETASVHSPETRRPRPDCTDRDAEVRLNDLKRRVDDAKPIAPASSIDEDKWNAMVTGKLSQYRQRSSMQSLQFTSGSRCTAEGHRFDLGLRGTNDGPRRARSVHSLLPSSSSVRTSRVAATEVSSDDRAAANDDAWSHVSMSADEDRVLLGRRGRDFDDDERSKSLSDLRTERDYRLYDLPSIDNVGGLGKSPFTTTADVVADKRKSSTAVGRHSTSQTDLWMRQSLERLDLPSWCRGSPRLNQEIVILKHAKSSDLTAVRCGFGSDVSGAERVRKSSDRVTAVSRPVVTFCNVKMMPFPDGGRKTRGTASATTASNFRLPSEKLRMKHATPTYSQIKTESFEDLMKSFGVDGSKPTPSAVPRCETAKEMYLRLKSVSTADGARNSEMKPNSSVEPTVTGHPTTDNSNALPPASAANLVNSECVNFADVDNSVTFGGRQLLPAATVENKSQSSDVESVNNPQPVVLIIANKRVDGDKINESKTDHRNFSSVTSQVSNAHDASGSGCQRSSIVDKSSSEAVSLCLEVDEDEETTTFDVTETEWKETQLDVYSEVCDARVQDDAEDKVREDISCNSLASACSIQTAPTSPDNRLSAADSRLAGDNLVSEENQLPTMIERDVQSDGNDDDWSIGTTWKANVKTTEVESDFNGDVVSDNVERRQEEIFEETPQSPSPVNFVQQFHVCGDDSASLIIHGTSSITVEQEVVEPDDIAQCVDGVTDEDKNGVETVKVSDKSFASSSPMRRAEVTHVCGEVSCVASIDVSPMTVEQEDIARYVDGSSDDEKNVVETVRMSDELFVLVNPRYAIPQSCVCNKLSNMVPNKMSTVTLEQEVIMQPENDITNEVDNAAVKIKTRRAKQRNKESTKSVMIDNEFDNSLLSSTAINLSRHQNSDELLEVPHVGAERDAVADDGIVQKRRHPDKSMTADKEHSRRTLESAEVGSMLEEECNSLGEHLSAVESCDTEHVKGGSVHTAAGECDEWQQTPPEINHACGSSNRQRKKLSSPKLRLKSSLQTVNINYGCDANNVAPAERESAVSFPEDDTELVSPITGRRVKRYNGCRIPSVVGDTTAEYSNGATADTATTAATQRARRRTRPNSSRQLQTSAEATNFVSDAIGDVDANVSTAVRCTLPPSSPSNGAADAVIDCCDDRRQHRASDLPVDTGNRTSGDGTATRTRRTKNSRPRRASGRRKRIDGATQVTNGK